MCEDSNLEQIAKHISYRNYLNIILLLFQLNVLPTYAYYQQAKKEWTAGTRSAYNKRDILSLIADITGHM